MGNGNDADFLEGMGDAFTLDNWEIAKVIELVLYAKYFKD